MDNNFAINWYVGCSTEEQKEERKQLLGNSKALLQLLNEIITIRQRLAESYKLKDYESPAWQYKLAHKNGQLEELDFLTKLIRPGI